MSRLTPKQYRAVEILADPLEVTKTLGHVAARIGVSSRTLTRWRSDAEFNRAVLEAVGRHVDPHLSEVFAALLEKAKEGDVPAARLIFEARQLIGGKAAVAVEVNEAPIEVKLSWTRHLPPEEVFKRLSARMEGGGDAPITAPERLLGTVDLAARQKEAHLIDPVADSERHAEELRRRAALEEERAERARREKAEAEEAREKRLKAEIDARTRALRAGEAYEVRPIEDW